MKLINKFFLTILILILFSSFIKNFISYQEGKKFYEQFKKNYEEEKKKNTKLKTQILKQTSAYDVEKKIRNEFNLLQPDEIAVILPTIKTTPAPTPTPSLPNWQKWFDLYRGKDYFNGS